MVRVNNLLIPDMYVPNILHVDFGELKERRGFVHYIVDVDNTVALRHAELPPDSVCQHIRTAVSLGHIQKLVLVSNIVVDRKCILWGKSRSARVRKIDDHLFAEHHVCIFPHLKPRPRPFRKAMEIMGSTPETTVVIGDQVFTDIKGANRLGLFSILVQPLGPDMWLTSLRRYLFERKIIANLTPVED